MKHSQKRMDLITLLMEVTDMRAGIEGLSTTLADQLSFDGKEKKSIELLNSRMDELIWRLAPVFDDMTNKEIEELIMFYESDLGRKLVSLQIKHGQQAAQITLEWAQGVLEEEK